MACQGAALKDRGKVRLEAAGTGLRKGLRVVRWEGEVKLKEIVRHVRAEFAPDLDCACLHRSESERVPGWLLYLVKLTEAFELRLDAPQEKLFAIPKEYKAYWR